MDPDLPRQQISDYIKANREKYTKEAIRERLIAAGHGPAAVDDAWHRVGGESAARTRPIGWRPGWREFLVLVVLGAIGAVAAYPGSGAPLVYLVVVSVGFALGKALSLMVDMGRSLAPAAALGLVAYFAASAFSTGSSPLLLAVAVVAVVMALLLLLLTRIAPGTAGMIAASIPILVWLVVTGTCISPLISRPIAG